MSKTIHYLHKTVHSCAGYQNFLENMAKGKDTKFNALFFFAFPFWLIAHKMYLFFFLIAFFYLNLSSLFGQFFDLNNEQSIQLMAVITTLFQTIFTFYSHKIYFLHLEQKFYEAKYDDKKCIKIAKPLPFYIVPIVMFIMLMSVIISFSVIHIIGLYIISFFH